MIQKRSNASSGVSPDRTRLVPTLRGPSAAALARGLDPVAEAMQHLTERFQSTNITFVIGKHYFDTGDHTFYAGSPQSCTSIIDRPNRR